MLENLLPARMFFFFFSHVNDTYEIADNILATVDFFFLVVEFFEFNFCSVSCITSISLEQNLCTCF